MSLPHENRCYTFYSKLVMKGFLTWGVHSIVVAIRHDLGAASNVVCPFCDASPSMRHYIEQCRMAHVFFHSRLLSALQDFCPCWGVSAVIGHDICFLHGHEMFGNRLGSGPFHVPSPYPYATIGFIGKVTPPGCGFSPCTRDHPHGPATCGVACFERGGSLVS